MCSCASQDYLAAPMPFLMGLHAPNLFMPTMRSGALEEVVIVDLDRGCMYNGPGQPLPKCALPWAEQLRDAFDLLKQTLRSPVEHESTPHIINLMQVPASEAATDCLALYILREGARRILRCISSSMHCQKLQQHVVIVELLCNEG